MTARQTKVLEHARAHIGSTAWSRFCTRTSANSRVTFNYGEPKCNLFVYEMLVAGGVKQDLPNTAGALKSYLPFFNTQPNPRPYCCSDWYNCRVPNMTYIGQGINALNKCWPGDIITEGKHMGIISGPRKTISASSIEGKIVENDWGWRKDHWKKVRIFRYHP